MVYPIAEDLQVRNHEAHIADARKALDSQEVLYELFINNYIPSACLYSLL